MADYSGRRKLFRSTDDRFIAGVCGGFARYMDLDPTLVRVIWFASIFAGGLGVFVYIASIILIEKNPGSDPIAKNPDQQTNSTILWGGLLIVIGLVLLLHRLDVIPDFNLFHLSWEIIWGLAFIAFGLFLVLPEKRNAEAQKAGGQSRKIYRSVLNKKISGVCAGLGEYFDTDPNIVRIGWLLLTFVSFGFGLIAYLILSITLPEKIPTYQEGSRTNNGGDVR